MGPHEPKSGPKRMAEPATESTVPSTNAAVLVTQSMARLSAGQTAGIGG